MMEPGNYVKLSLKSGLQVEGIVESWSKEEVILSTKGSQNKLYIFNVMENVILAKVVLDDKPRQVMENLKKQFEEVKAAPIGDLRIKKIAELKTMMNEQEKIDIAESLTEHKVSTTNKANYGYPGFFKIPSPK